MIFIGIIDPIVGKENQGLNQHKKWFIDYCNEINKEYDIYEYDSSKINSENLIKELEILFNIENEEINNINIYMYINAHTTRKNDEHEYLILNENSTIKDDIIMDLIFKNKVKNLSIFIESCYSEGIYEPTEENLIKKDIENNEPIIYNGYNCMINNKGIIYYERNNITVITTSLKNQKSWQYNLGNEGIGLATLTLINLNKNIFNISPLEIVNYLIEKIGDQQVSKFNTTKFIISWF